MKDLAEISSLGFSVAKKLTLGAIQSFENKKTETMDNFYSELFKGLIDEDIVSYEKEFIKPTQEYCYTLLNAALIDEEKEKVIYYSRLYKYILSNQSIVKSKKLNLLKTLKELSFESIQLLPKIYVYQNYPTTNTTSLREYIDNLIKNPDQSYDLNILSQFGILNQVPLYGGHTFEPSRLFDEVICILFQQKDLNPEILNIQVEEKKLLLLVEGMCGNIVNYINKLIIKETKYKLESKDYSQIIKYDENIELKKYKYVICLMEMMPSTRDISEKLKQENNILYITTAKNSENLLSESNKIYNLSDNIPNDIDEFIKELKK